MKHIVHDKLRKMLNALAFINKQGWPHDDGSDPVSFDLERRKKQNIR